MSARVLWVIVLGFLAGVFLRSLAALSLSFAAFFALLAAAVILLLLSGSPRFRHGILAALALFALAGGIVRMDSAVVRDDPALAARIGSGIAIEGVVSDEPDAREGSTRLLVRADALVEGGITAKIDAGILVVAPAHAAAAYGDRIRAEGVLRLPEAFDAGAGREFDYPAYLAQDGVLYELAFARDVEVVGAGKRDPVKAAALLVKRTFLEGLALALPEPAAGLAGGITVGDKRGLGAELAETFRTVSLTHIVVLSGYNIMIVIYALGWALAKARAPRALEFCMALSVALLFALMTGLAAASVRAAVMASIAAVGKMTGRLYLASRALALVAAGMVLWNPYILAFDPGFQLSVLATAGLIAFTPIVVTRLKFITPRLHVREITATTIAAQIAVLPLLLYQTGNLSLVALPANFLVLLAVPWAMLCSAIAALGGLIFSPPVLGGVEGLGVVVGFPAYALLSYIIEAAKLFASLPFASVALPAFSAWWLVPAYGALLLFAYRKNI
ncbi:hypothetical protein A3C21_03820 [Candidatus Kaiserbacteria bacterium RIFCSPHIGHO2_02_FULL_59_21]|uniref:ComEC/Rec2-related protein domain-containing protein n=1 Tax=Candidatus Kaiserbacteria bacterium RIFCSPHIGHO2_02_FULL_59_21 TaxID=1798500 RepID=A0A1F6E1N8_9BACT|nr:MAG: hypothetical protein A3C21_03820 [Candidatus Kaiserbacteria bacterium RIFCSPHIGHO2_02_FULL_59_21]